MGRPFTPERLDNIRRIRKARRLFKQTPLFAFHLMEKDYPGYTCERFRDDLRRRSKAKQKKTKTTLKRYGRYHRFLQLLSHYRITNDLETARQAAQLRSNMTKPYRILVRCGNESREFSASPLIDYSVIEQLNVQLNACGNMREAEELITTFRKKY